MLRKIPPLANLWMPRSRTSMTGSKKRILLIDDEISGLDQLKSSLATNENEWIIELSKNPSNPSNRFWRRLQVS